MASNEEIENVKRQITTYFGVSFENILEKNNSRQVSNARNYLYYILHVDCGVSFGQLAKMFNRTSRGIQMRIADTKYLIENQKKFNRIYIEIKAI